MGNHFDVIILGGGAAGLTAGIYLSRAKVNTLALNEGTIGGQMTLTHEIANYPGVENISGYMLAKIMKKQAQKFGAIIKSGIKITGIDLSGNTKEIALSDGAVFTSDSVLIATGGKSRALNVPGEEEYKGKGISYCAACDGDFFQDKEIIVVGGGNSALEEAVSLTKYASKVTVLHQFDHFQAFKYYVDQAKSNPKIDFIMESEITEFVGDDKLREVVYQNQRTKEFFRKKIDGVFIFVGYLPNTEKIEGHVALNDRKEIIVDKNMATNIPGVFAAGDSIAKRYRQVTTAVGEATVAALSAAEYIDKLKKKIAVTG